MDVWEYEKYRHFNKNSCDHIEVPFEVFNKVVELTEPIWNKTDSIAINPFLEEGIMNIEAMFYGTRGTFQLYFKVVEEGIYYNLLGRPLDFFHDNEGKVSIDGKEISETEYFQSIDSDEGLWAIEQTVVHCIKSFCYCMYYIERVREDPKYVDVHKERKTITKKPKGGKGKNRKVVLNKTIYRVTYDENFKGYESRTFERHTESWTVSGHPRHYKNGKVIFIKPYVKGQGDKTPKTYVLTE